MPGRPADGPLLTGQETLKQELRKRSAFLREIGAEPCAENVVAVARPATTTRADRHGRSKGAAPVRRRGSRRGSRSTRAGPDDDPDEPEPHRGDDSPATGQAAGQPPNYLDAPDVGGQRPERGGSA